MRKVQYLPAENHFQYESEEGNKKRRAKQKKKLANLELDRSSFSMG